MLWSLLAALVARLPWASMPTLGMCLGWCVGTLLRIRRAHVGLALSRAGVAAPHEVARAVYANLGTGVFELLWSFGRPADETNEKVRVRGWGEVERALSQGRGLVVATAHTGNWDLAACAMARRVALTVVTKRLSWRSLDRFWQTSRANRGIDLVAPEGAIVHVRNRLSQGAAVVFLIDQAPMRCRGVEQAPFLGAVADHDMTFALMAARCRAPVVLAFPLRRRDGTHEVQIRGVFSPPARPSRAWVRQTTRAAARGLEVWVSEHPDQWLWLHRRWRRPGEGSRSRRGRPAELVHSTSEQPAAAGARARQSTGSSSVSPSASPSASSSVSSIGSNGT